MGSWEDISKKGNYVPYHKIILNKFIDNQIIGLTDSKVRSGEKVTQGKKFLLAGQQFRGW